MAFGDKVICNFKELVPKKPKAVMAVRDRSNYEKSPCTKRCICEHFGN